MFGCGHDDGKQPGDVLLRPYLQSRLNTRGREGLATIELGEPLFVEVDVRHPGPQPIIVGVDGSTLAQGSFCTLFTKQQEALDRFAKFGGDVSVDVALASPGGVIHYADISPSKKDGDTATYIVKTVWFAERDRPGASPNLTIDATGEWRRGVRFSHLLLSFANPRSPSRWFGIQNVSAETLKVVDPTPSVKVFAEEIGKVISPNHVVARQHRDLLRAWQDKAGSPVKHWAQWLLIRSYLADDKWRTAVAQKQPDAIDQLSATRLGSPVPPFGGVARIRAPLPPDAPTL